MQLKSPQYSFRDQPTTRSLFVQRLKNHYGTAQPKEWIDPLLRPHSMLVFFLIATGFTFGVAIIKIVSSDNNGLADVVSSLGTIHGHSVNSSLLWTFFPVLIFQVLSLWFTAIVNALGERQPFVGLKTPQGSGSRTSILLDYPHNPAPLRPYVAARNRHWVLSVAFCAAILEGVFLTSLASHLLTASIIPITTSENTTLTSTFQPLDFTGASDMTTVLDTTSKILVYDGTPPAWTTVKESLQSFKRPSLRAPSSEIVYLTDTIAYSAHLQCRALDKDEYELRPEPRHSVWAFSANGDGCDFPETQLNANPGYKYYMQTYSNVSCSFDSGLSRLFVVAANTPDPHSIDPSEVVVLSCRTSYFESHGLANVSYTSATSSVVLNSFRPHEIKILDDPLPIYYQNFETQIHQASVVDPTATFSATDFGRVIWSLAQKQAPHDSFNPAVLCNATQTVFTTAHAVMVSTFLWQPNHQGATIQGTLSVPTLRLTVVNAIADILLGALAALAAISVWIGVSVINNPSSLYEQPRGLLSSAILLCDSSINTLAREMRNERQAKQDGKAMEHAKERGWLWPWTEMWNVWPDRLLRKKWKIRDWETPTASKIVEV